MFRSLLVSAAVAGGLLIAPTAANAAAVSATVDVTGTLRMRASAQLSAAVVGSALRDGQKVSVSCVLAGATVKGKVRTSNLWARLAVGRYVPYAYLRAARSIARCAPAAPPVVTRSGTVRSTDGVVNLRSGPSAAAEARGSVASGARVLLDCSVVGTQVKGTVRTTNQWDRTAAGLYLSHAYVQSAALPVCKTAPGPWSPALSPAQFIAAAVPGAQAGWRQYGVPPSVTIAQAILESGWGRSNLSSTHRNYFGIKCQNGRFGDWADGCAVYRTNECTKAGVCFVTTGTFRTYASMARSFRDHGAFLRANSRYQPAFSHTRNPDAFIAQVWKAGYATDPKYVSKIKGIMVSNNLYRYDTWK